MRCAAGVWTWRWRDRGIVARTGSDLHESGKLFCIRIFCLSPLEGARPDHQPCLHRDKGRQCVQRQNHGHPSTLADRLYLSQCSGPGLVPSQHDLLAGNDLPATMRGLDDYSRYIILWKLYTNMRAEDVTELPESGVADLGRQRQIHVFHKPRLLSPSHRYYISIAVQWTTAGQWTTDPVMSPGIWLSSCRTKVWSTCAAHRTPRPQDRIALGPLLRNALPGSGAVAPDPQEPDFSGKPLPARRSRSPDRRLLRPLQASALPRESEQRHARRRLLRTWQSQSTTKGKGQTKIARSAAIVSPPARRIMKQPNEPDALLV